MGRIVISTNVSIDGVVEDPDGHEGSGWAAGSPNTAVRTSRGGRRSSGGGARMDALLLGRRSDAWFADALAARTGEWADRLNLSQVRRVLDPRGSALERRDAAEGRRRGEVSKLKRELDGEIVVYASYQLGRTLLEHDLVDELRLFVFPVVLGQGERLFGETTEKKALRLLSSRTVGDGLAFLTYEVLA